MEKVLSTEVEQKIEMMKQAMLDFALETFANSKNKSGTELNIAMSIAHEFMSKP